MGESGGKCVILKPISRGLTKMRLLGNIEAKTDSKGRVFLPAAFRKVLQGESSDTLVLRKDVYQPCLTLYSESAWSKQMDFLCSKINRWNPAHQQIYRQFLSAVELVTPDSSGRILIPKRLLESAEIRQGIRFIGMGDYIEIWSSENTVKPFVSHEEFTDALEELLSDQAPTSGGQPCK